jgi:predicted RecB family nuclease
MLRTDGELRLAPTDLSGFVVCAHLTQLESAATRGEGQRPVLDDPYADLVQRKGAQHEAAVLERYRASGRRVTPVPRFGEPGFSPDRARQLTEAALREGADVISQAYFQHGTWHGVADFLERQSDGGYEPVEAKLARTTRPDHVLQLSFYAEQIERLQGRLPEHMHVELGSGRRETFRTEDFSAYYRHVRSRFLSALEGPAGTYPWPCEHCPVCRWRHVCHERLAGDDHPILIPGFRRAHVEPLASAGLVTIERLGDAAEQEVDGLRGPTFDALRHQARLLLHRRRTGRHRVDLLPPEEGRGFALLPEPSPGDVWLDLEGYPFFEPDRGLEYLFGLCSRGDDGEVRYEALWAQDPETEKDSFERLIDRIVERRRRFPRMHVYHYADYERSALRRLMGVHGTREDEVDELLRGHVLVDLFRVTRQALRASVEGYSIKKIEALYGFPRTSEVKGGNESSVCFEQWLECRDDALLDAIEVYNEEDCRSTEALHRWLLSQRPPDLPWRTPPERPEADEKAVALDGERGRLREELLLRSSREGDPGWLLAQLLDYHQREAKPQWWEWFHHLELDEEELMEDTHTIGGLALVGEPAVDKQSFVYTLAFPAQEHRIDDRGVDPASKVQYNGLKVDDDRGIVLLRRSRKRADEPLPRGLVPPGPIPNHAQRRAIMKFARSWLAPDGAPPALSGVLERQRPRVDLAVGLPEAALTLDGSYLIVQGPPGAGKTWQGARMAVALLRAGRRVGVTAFSHKAIDNLLVQIEREAARQGFRFRGRKKHSDEDDAFAGDCIESSAEVADLLDPELRLVAGTSWLFAREEFHGHLDTLIVDEAGQLSLADTIASGMAARNLVLLGDPNQLPQASQGNQPEEARASVLQHLLAGHEVVPSDLGIFLEETWRLHPETCAFTSEAYYKGRLRPAEVCARRSVEAGNGLALLPVAHEARSQSSREEAEAVALEIERLLGTLYRDHDGSPRALTAADVLVVAPYNAQVRMLKSCVPEGVRVGTVDRFQGQEAPVVIVSFASSSGADAPRGIAFAFDRHRVNVATSRAQCRVVIAYEPRLLEAECRTPEHMRLMNAVCRFVERATGGAGAAPTAWRAPE